MTEAAKLWRALRDVEGLARRALSLASEWSRWNGQSVKYHVETAQTCADAADAKAEQAAASAAKALGASEFAQDQIAALWKAIEALGGDTSGRELNQREIDWEIFMVSLSKTARTPGAAHD